MALCMWSAVVLAMALGLDQETTFTHQTHLLLRPFMASQAHCSRPRLLLVRSGGLRSLDAGPLPLTPPSVTSAHGVVGKEVLA
jgi:hypothetical protein